LYLRRPFGKRAEFFDKSGSQVVEAEGVKREVTEVFYK
jgi:hypothetical protein